MTDSGSQVPEELEHIARRLALENGEAEPTILRIYWFPHSEQIRLVEIDEEAIPDEEEAIRPFYFRPMSEVPFVSGIALVPPSGEKVKHVPADWGDWSSGVVVFNRNGNK